MLTNHLKVALRNLWREKEYAAVNVLGLATGIAVCALILAYVRFETSFDEFHEKGDRMVRVSAQGNALSPDALANALEQSAPSVEDAVRLTDWGGKERKVSRGATAYYEQNVFYADSTFFEVFSFPLRRGDPSRVLDRPFTVVLTQPMAEKYFGEADPIGETLEITTNWGTHAFEVTGVAERPPANAHIQFRAVTSYRTLLSIYPSPEEFSSWSSWTSLTYVLLDEGTGTESFQARLRQLVARESSEQVASALAVQPLESIHLHSHRQRELETPGDPAQLYIFGSLALFVLLLASLNYVNLAIAQASRRASEVGIRKAIGGSRRRLAVQFLGEAVVVGLLAGAVAFGLFQLGLPALSQITGTPADAFPFTGWFALLLTTGAGLLTGLLAGCYPALHLARMEPADVLRGQHAGGRSAGSLRKGLVVFQFAVSVAFIAAALIIQSQIGYMQSEQLRFKEEQVISLSVRDALEDGYQPFRQELLSHASISDVTATEYGLPTNPKVGGAMRPEGISQEEYRKRAQEGSLVVNSFRVEAGFTDVMEIAVVRGRDLEQAASEGEYTPVLINRAAAEQIGWNQPIGKTFPCCTRPTPRVVGVVEDFHYTSLKTEIRPLVLTRSSGAGLRHVHVRFEGRDAAQVLGEIRTVWAEFGGGTPLDYSFLDSRFRQAYEAQKRLASVSTILSAIAALLAGMGLFGLASYSVRRRTKEISIRKVLGATTERVVGLVSGDFLKLVGIGFVVGIPIALVVMNRWLENFAYRIELGPLYFVGAGALVLVIALIAVVYQSATAALLNPAETLRYE